MENSGFHVDATNGDLFSFNTEAEARAFYRGFQYAKRLVIRPTLDIVPAAPSTTPEPPLPPAGWPAGPPQPR